ncbi:MAG: hypothetical protein C0522_09440 [Rhodocyclaceae bacterium]|nr:hypothetical protein [Rhodocyclaceae bacterium]
MDVQARLLELESVALFKSFVEVLPKCGAVCLRHLLLEVVDTGLDNACVLVFANLEAALVATSFGQLEQYAEQIV